ncbi:MAG TPA: PIG-L family deacetylase [Gemmatimonadales bacterium]|nr:PIG-L family deacetylase [Gemmatimonadales bacterium]
MIAAHPDDEDTELLTVLARGMGAEAAYLALTRGEGGQNLIGTELGPALGVLRTEELLAARSLDGARQYFTRAYDFGFSKSLADTWKFWNQDSVLKDVVRVVRKFQPQVIVAVFSGTPRDGHGQHQASGWAAREAFKAAADPARFPDLSAEGLGPWKTLKLYQSARFDTASGVATLDGGALDRAVGQSYLQIAMRGRSLHRSQDMGVAQRMGPSTVRIRLLEDLTGGGAELFAGIDTALASALPAGAAPDAREGAERVQRALADVTTWSSEGIAAARTAWANIASGPAETAATRDQLARLDVAASIASGVVCDATTPTETITPGSRVTVSLTCWNTGKTAREVSAGVTLLGREVYAGASRTVPPGGIVTDSAAITVPADAAPTQPYYLRAPMQAAFYQWRREDVASWSEPAEPPPLLAEFGAGEGVTIRREVVRRSVDQALGEVRAPVFIAPRVDVHLTPGSGLWSTSRTSSHELVVSLYHHASDTTTGTVRLIVPAEWTAPAPQRFALYGRSADSTLRFQVRPPASVTPGAYQIRAVVTDAGGRDYTSGTERVVYPHIRSRQLVSEATSRAVVADIKLPPPNNAIAYVRGAADRIPESLVALGVKFTLISADSLMSGALPRFNTVVIGPRAWETEPALSEHNDRLLAWVRDGGTVIVQYQQFQYLRGGYAPFQLSLAEKVGGAVPARIAAPRVAEEDATVTVLEPANRVFQSPNPVTALDWQGWVQERGLYFPRSWAEEWTPLLEMADTGEPPQRGAMLIAKCGRGTYVYTGLSFFRELPAAVPGAARLFMNLLALGKPRG